MRIGIDMMGADFAPGSTIHGAILVGTLRIINVLPGIIRPAIAAPIPNLEGNMSVLLDLDLNPDARPDVLYQYGLIGTIYSKLVYGIEEAGVALLNIGLEEYLPAHERV
ncbi:MAG: hypothetical protein V2B15_19020 [Bacteroidota bacterium]